MSAIVTRTWLRITFVLLISTLVVGPGLGCASATTINSDPLGARVKIDGVMVGNTPVLYEEDMVFLWTKKQVTLEKTGYNTHIGQIKASFSPIYIVVGILCCLPVIVLGEFKPQYSFVLARKESQASDGGSQDLEEIASVDFD
jgi:hypothetical protein